MKYASMILKTRTKMIKAKVIAKLDLGIWYMEYVEN